MTDTELFARGEATLLASWEAYARSAVGAVMRRLPGAATAVFPAEPERSVYNNAVLKRELTAGAGAAALDEVEAAYSAAGVSRFAIWVHEREEPMQTELARRGYALDTTTRAMGMELDDLRVPRPRVELAELSWAAYLRAFGLPAGLLARADLSTFHLLVARLEGQPAAAALAFDWDGDRGIYNVVTLEHARRRGLATALTALHLHEGLARGCRTASLQSTPMAERVYAALGFRNLGRILEYVPRG